LAPPRAVAPVIVYYDIDLSKLLDGEFGQLERRIRDSQIERQVCCLAAVCLNLLNRTLQICLASRAKSDMSPLLGQTQGDRPSDSLASSGHDRDFAFERPHGCADHRRISLESE
jgi:hypothetical protein